jgi:hypothetical protein
MGWTSQWQIRAQKQPPWKARVTTRFIQMSGGGISYNAPPMGKPRRETHGVAQPPDRRVKVGSQEVDMGLDDPAFWLGRVLLGLLAMNPDDDHSIETFNTLYMGEFDGDHLRNMHTLLIELCRAFGDDFPEDRARVRAALDALFPLERRYALAMKAVVSALGMRKKVPAKRNVVFMLASLHAIDRRFRSALANEVEELLSRATYGETGRNSFGPARLLATLALECGALGTSSTATPSRSQLGQLAKSFNKAWQLHLGRESRWMARGSMPIDPATGLPAPPRGSAAEAARVLDEMIVVGRKDEKKRRPPASTTSPQVSATRRGAAHDDAVASGGRKRKHTP